MADPIQSNEDELFLQVFGTYSAIHTSIKRVRKEALEEKDEERQRKFFLFVKGTYGLLQLHRQNELGVIYGTLSEHNGLLPEFGAFYAKRLELDKELEALLQPIEAHIKGEENVNLVELWEPVEAHVQQSCAHAREYFDAVSLGNVDDAIKKKVSGEIEKNNRNAPFAPLSISVLFWSLDDHHYDKMIRATIPKPVRILLLNMFWYMGAKDIVEFVPHYKNTFNC